MNAASDVAYGAIACVHAAAEVTGFPNPVVVWMLHVVDRGVRHVMIYNPCIGKLAELVKLVTTSVRSVLVKDLIDGPYLLFAIKPSSILV